MGVLYIEIDKKPLEFNTRDLRFLLNIESKLVGEDDHLTPEILKDLSVWGNYIVISSEDTLKDKFIQFIPDEDLLKVLPQLKLETIKSRSILMNDTTHLFKNFIWMIWGAS